MKRQTQKTGVRKYFGGDLIALQAEPLRALDAIFSATGACIVSGCEVSAVGDTVSVAAGIVALRTTDVDSGEVRVMVMPFGGVTDVVLPLYLSAECDVVERVYGDGRVKPISYNYFAVASGVAPANDSLVVDSDGGLRFADAMQSVISRYATVTAAEKTAWNAKESTAGAQAKADKALGSAKSYADTAIAALVNSSPAALDTLQELAKALGNDPNFATTVMSAIGERVTVAAFNAALAGKADANHSHSNYSLTNHAHSGYATTNHSHSELDTVHKTRILAMAHITADARVTNFYGTVDCNKQSEGRYFLDGFNGGNSTFFGIALPGGIYDGKGNVLPVVTSNSAAGVEVTVMDSGTGYVGMDGPFYIIIFTC